jgi:hypothetical protein
MSEDEKKDLVYNIHKEVVGLADQIKGCVDAYFAKDVSHLIDHNEKFLVISRAINISAKLWYDHFAREFNPENKVEKASKEKEESK